MIDKYEIVAEVFALDIVFINLKVLKIFYQLTV